MVELVWKLSWTRKYYIKSRVNSVTFCRVTWENYLQRQKRWKIQPWKALKHSEETRERIGFWSPVKYGWNSHLETFGLSFQMHGLWGLEREQLPAWTVGSSVYMCFLLTETKQNQSGRYGLMPLKRLFLSRESLKYSWSTLTRHGGEYQAVCVIFTITMT